MKKIKLLTSLSALPIFGIAITPLTSCGNKKDATHWTVTFNCDEGATLSGETTIKVDKNSKWSSIAKPTINLKDGYTSLGWYKDSQLITDDFDISSDLTITAKTEKCTPSTSFEWEYDSSNWTASVKKYNFTTYDVILPTKVTNAGKTFTVTSIGNEAFKDTQITTVVIPSTITVIGQNAFSGCNLSSATFLCDEKNWTLLNNDDCLEWNVSDSSKNAKALMQGANYYWHTGIGFVNDSWENIINYANQGLQVLKAKYLDKLGVESFVGLERKIEINGKIHWVRVIGEEHDTIAEGEKKGQKATLTFELVTLLSDSNGYCLTSEWSNDSLFYPGSILRKNLTGEGQGTLRWYGSDKKTTSTETRTALQMLPNELQSAIKKVTKYGGQFEDKLFPLTYTEMAQIGITELSTPYKYWLEHNTDASRIKTNVNGNNEWYWLATSGISNLELAYCVSTSGSIMKLTQSPEGVSFGFCI